jgi:hypothetical protein
LGKVMQMLLNIDKPHRTCTLHNADCPLVPVPYGTPHKPINQLGRDGGWFTVASTEGAREVAKREFGRGAFVPCERCQER